MSVLKAYTTEVKLEAFLGKDIVAGEADDAINEAVNLIDQLTGRNFIADDTASIKLFDGNDNDYLLIDECISISKVEKGDNYFADTYSTITLFVQGDNTKGYIRMPINYSEDAIPIRRVFLRGYLWLKGIGNNRITAKWGYSATVPQAIALATTILASGIYMYNKGGTSGNIKSEKIGMYSVAYNNTEGWDALAKAKLIIEQYTKPVL